MGRHESRSEYRYYKQTLQSGEYQPNRLADNSENTGGIVPAFDLFVPPAHRLGMVAGGEVTRDLEHLEEMLPNFGETNCGPRSLMILFGRP